MLLDVRFGYGAYAPLIQRDGDGMCFMAGPDALMLRGPLALQEQDGRVSAYLTVKKGERIPLQLGWFPSHERAPAALDADQALASTEAYWQAWAGRCAYQGRWRDAVLRSLITLKAMTYSPTGGVVAAPTTSLPEAIGGVRNWDYRFCWLRDASLTLDAFMIGGYVDEARAFRDWLLRAIAGDPADLQIMYGIDGARRLTEFELDWLPGYEGSKPVRVGNAASGQFQLDVYGEVMSAIAAARRLGMPGAERGWIARQGRARVPRGRLAAPRRRHLGGARRAAALHPLEGDGVGRDRPHGALDPGAGHGRRRGAEHAPAPGRAARAHPRRGLRARLQPAHRRVHAVVRQRAARRQRAGHPALRLPARQRSARRQHGGGDREGSAARRLRAPLRHRARHRRTARLRGRVPGVQLLARRQLRVHRPAARRRGAVRAAARAAQPPRPARRGVRARAAPPDRQLPAGVLAPGAGRRPRRSSRAPLSSVPSTSPREDTERCRRITRCKSVPGRAQKRLVTARNVILSLVSRRRPASVRTKLHSRS